MASATSRRQIDVNDDSAQVMNLGIINHTVILQPSLPSYSEQTACR